MSRVLRWGRDDWATDEWMPASPFTVEAWTGLSVTSWCIFFNATFQLNTFSSAAIFRGRVNVSMRRLRGHDTTLQCLRRTYLSWWNVPAESTCNQTINWNDIIKIKSIKSIVIFSVVKCQIYKWVPRAGNYNMHLRNVTDLLSQTLIS